MSKNYKIIEGFKCYDLQNAYKNSNYPSNYFHKQFKLEKNNFWFIARNNIINILFLKFGVLNKKLKFLEIGCGTGFVLEKISKNKNVETIGSELYIQGLKYAKKRLPNSEFIQLNAQKIPFKEDFESVGAFDVLEHIDNDDLVIKNVYRCLKKNGIFLITVPQHMWLWSTQDDAAFHKRRYSRKELFKKLNKAGFKIRYASSFLFLLLPLMILSRVRYKNHNKIKQKEYSYSEFEIPKILNELFKLILKIEEIGFKFGLSFPFGGSLIVVAKK